MQFLEKMFLILDPTPMGWLLKHAFSVQIYTLHAIPSKYFWYFDVQTQAPAHEMELETLLCYADLHISFNSYKKVLVLDPHSILIVLGG